MLEMWKKDFAEFYAKMKGYENEGGGALTPE